MVSIRNSLIVWALKEYFPNFQSFLEVGCGTGFVLAGIAKAFPSVETVGSEIFVQGLPFAAARAPTGKFIQMDGRRIPYEDEFDVIGAFDVLEHIPEDDAVLAGMHRAVKLGGGILYRAAASIVMERNGRICLPRPAVLSGGLALQDKERRIRNYSEHFIRNTIIARYANLPSPKRWKTF